ncbi:VWA domain-containing protein [Isosphaeraceae bacterium EP7]
MAHPERLWLLAIVPILGLWVRRGRGLRRRDWAALERPGRPPGDGAWAWLAAIALLVLALAQPRWGRGPGAPPEVGRDVVLVVDVSRSMAAEDAIPSRLGVAAESASDLVRSLGPGDRAAVVAFSGRGVLRCPLTENFGAVLDALARLKPGEVRPGGTNLGEALEVAALAFDDEDRSGGRSVVIFSDGEDHEGRWPVAAARLSGVGAVVHAVAIGDDGAGHPVPAGKPGEFVTFDGKPVLSKRSDEALAQVAEATGGAVLRLGLASADLGPIFASRLAPAAKRKLDLMHPPERSERFGLFVLAALTVGCLGARPRGRSFGLGRLGPGIWLALALVAAGESPAAAVRRGVSEYRAGRFDAALKAFDAACEGDASAAVPRYDAAATLYRLGRFEESMARYREARERGSAALRMKADYAMGNVALALGDPASAVGHYDACLASGARGPGLDSVRLDAAINRKFAEDQLAKKPAEAPDQSRSGDGGDGPKPDAGEPPSPPAGEDGEPPGGGGPAGGQGEGKGDEPDEGRDPGKAGGAGGSGGGTPPRGESPGSRLERAVGDAREARRMRLPDGPPEDVDRAIKDW